MNCSHCKSEMTGRQYARPKSELLRAGGLNGPPNTTTWKCGSYQIDGEDIEYTWCCRALTAEAIITKVPISVYCNNPQGKKLVAQVANVDDVLLFNETYNNEIFWNMDLVKENK